MQRDEIDVMWQQALQDSVKDGEMFTRYHFAKMIAAKEREACAVLIDENANKCSKDSMAQMILFSNATAIRARGEA